VDCQPTMESEETPKFMDFKIMSNDGQIHPCRKHVLYSNSPPLKAMLEMDCAETNKGLMKVQDYDSQTVKNFIKYTHTPKAGSDIVEMARRAAKPGEHIFRRQFDKMAYTPDLLLMAHCYQVDDLQIDCIEYLSKNLTKENVINVCKAANTIDCSKLKKAALDFLAHYFNQGGTFDIPGPGYQHSDYTSQLMEELLRHLFRHKHPADQGQIVETMDILEENHISSEDMHNAFVVACKKGNLPMVNWMMDMPGKIDNPIPDSEEEETYSCYTLGFWFACQRSHLNIVNRLLDIQQHDLLNVDAPIKDTDVSPFSSHSLPPGSKTTAFFEACLQGNSDVVQRLLELPGGTINFEVVGPINEDSENEDGTGFMAACSLGHLTVVKLLLQLPEGSINIQAEDVDGYNGFMNACSQGHLSVIKSFLELPQGRFNVDETNKDGETGLEIAVRKGHLVVEAAIRQYKRDSSE